MTIADNEVILRKELVALFGHLQKVRKELAALRRPDADAEEDHFFNMADQLDAIVEATEGATNTIMESVEDMESALEQVRGRVDDPQVNALLDRMTDRMNGIFEACSFQDLTGQRIGKVLKSVRFIEERVNSLVRMWGKDELARVVVELKEEEQDPDKKLLNGPQRQSEAISQDDVDKLFSQDDIDKLFG